MKNLFKKAAVVTLVAGTALSLASCGGGSDEEHTIVFYHTMGDDLQKVLNTAIEGFEAKYPGWKIEQNKPGGYDQVRDAIIGDLQGGTQPDLAYCYPDHVARYMESGKVIDLNKFIKSTGTVKATVDGAEKDVPVGYTEAEIADFVTGYWNEGHADNYSNYEKYGFTADSMLTVPYVKSTEVLYYNADALKELNLEVPTTWDEMWTAAEAIHKKYPSSTPVGYDSEANWFITMANQNGWGYTSAKEPHFLFDNADTRAWLEDLTDKFSDGLFTTKEIYGSYTSNLFTAGAETGSVFSIGSSGGASHQKSEAFKWGVAPLPGSKLADGSINANAISQGPSLVMLEGETDNKDEKQQMTWMFIKEILEPTFQCKFSMQSGYNPARKSAFEVDAYQDFLEDKTNIVAVTANVAKSMSDKFFVSPAFNGSTSARDQVGSALTYTVTGQKPAEKALKDAMKKCGA